MARPEDGSANQPNAHRLYLSLDDNSSLSVWYCKKRVKLNSLFEASTMLVTQQYTIASTSAHAVVLLNRMHLLVLG